MPTIEIEDFEDSALVAFLDSYKMRMEMLDNALKLESDLQQAQATADRRLELLRLAKYFLEFVPLGMSNIDTDIYHVLMEDLQKELGDG